MEYQVPLKEGDEELGKNELLTRVDLHILSPHNFKVSLEDKRTNRKLLSHSLRSETIVSCTRLDVPQMLNHVRSINDIRDSADCDAMGLAQRR